ncbi:MAG TPA: hypothetical protein VMF91_13240 [Bryobacteraceae bacterium]|nr:hypothetical protein [Bryobacteraceae bacterium]
MTAQHPEAEYAVWTIPGTEFKVSYWLSLFHEIDFQVNEGYRRIPHGGIEIGGLLFGHAEENFARIEAFRIIECEHSRGPSFLLSERDLSALHTQLSSVGSDAELQGLDLLGWFVAHTRSELEVNERESSLFGELFPEAGKLMILIKPERFQPTRFVFLVRGADGKLAGGASENAIILPLPGRAERAGTGPVASIPAPSTKPPESTAPREPLGIPAERPAVSEDGKGVPLPASKTAAPDLPVAPIAVGAAPPVPDFPSIEEIRRRRSEAIRQPDPFEARAAHQQIAQNMQWGNRRSNARLAIVLFIAAALGCVVGYFIYLQLPPAVIPLNIEKRAPELIVSWPPEQTRDAVYAALRIDDGDPIPLSSAQKAQGQAAIHSAGGNVKIELIAQHWMRDSRGILRYVEPFPAASAGPPAGSSQ